MRIVRVLVLALMGLGLMLQGVATPARAATDPTLTAKIKTVLSDSRVTNAKVGVVVGDASTGEYLYRRSSTTALMPASNMKMITAGAALRELGTSYRFHTDVLGAAPVKGVVSGNLYLKGFGDPTSRVYDYRALAQALAAQGVKTVSGSLVADATWFDEQRYSPYWSTSYAGRYYAGEVSALTITGDTDYDAGTVIVKVAAASRTGARPVITTIPSSAKKYLTIKNGAYTKSTGSSTISVSRAYGSATITVSGKIAKYRSTKKWVTVSDPKRLAVRIFRTELASAGVRVVGETTSGAAPKGLVLLARDQSMTLSQLMLPFLKLSNNSHAEAFTKAMGAEATGRGTWSSGLARTRAYLASTGADLATVRLVDGSGLSRSNRLTATALAQALVHARRQPWFSAYYTALPIAGINERMVGGTLRYRMVDTAAEGNCHAKTGTLTGVTSLSGYVKDRNGRVYVFAMISNYTRTSPRPVEDKLVLVLAHHSR